MILSAYIVEVPVAGDNHFKVRIPFFEDNTGTKMIFKAFLCNAPGVYGGFRVGDVVFVSFENEKYDTAIILGRMYINDDQDVNNYISVNKLDITNSVNLPDNTTIGGYSSNDIFELFQKTENMLESSVGGDITYEVIG